MAAKKRAARRSANRSSSAKKRGRAARGKGVRGVVSLLGRVFSGRVVGASLLVTGLFFTVAFITGRGAFLGEAGLTAATQLAGVVGLALAPLSVLTGALLLIGRLVLGRTLGAALLLLALATTLAATLPPEQRFDAAAYSDRGGLLGSGLYAAIYAAGGTVGAAFMLVALCALGLYLLTGVT